ncbi:MAG: ubiquinol-cytochrome C chaperone family protein [Hyphomicrobiales bacterium]|nr:ubiquinol-cytochrome C chaperone family protein [Hyphomicrobiales bacterium]
MRMPAVLKRLIGARNGTPHLVYGALVAQARKPVFYADLGVPDTPAGRYDMIVLHAFLLFGRLRRNDEERQLAQLVFDAMFVDLDRSLREMGIGDLSVPKKIKRMAEAFYGRVGAYEAAFKDDSMAMMKDAVARNLYAGTDAPSAPAAAIAQYAFAARDHLAGLSLAEIRAADLAFPEPAVTGIPS